MRLFVFNILGKLLNMKKNVKVDEAAGVRPISEKIQPPSDIPPPPPIPSDEFYARKLQRTESQLNQDLQLQLQAVKSPSSKPNKPSEYSLMNTKNNLIARDIGSFRHMMDTVETTFWAHKTRCATSVDLIAIYLKGQKILYIESKSHCEYFLNFLMVPAICVSAICTVLSVSMGDYKYGAYVVSSLTALNSFLLAMISYLKLDAKAESHRVSAYKFDKLQTKCEFFSGKIMHFSDTKLNQIEDVSNKLDSFIESLEHNIEEIKEINQFIIPSAIRYRYPRLYSTNIFSEIKKRRNSWKIKTHELNLIYNKICDVQSKESDIKEEKLKDLNAIKENLIHDVIGFNSEILGLDNILSKEIDKYIEYRRQKRWYHCILRIFCCWMNSYSKSDIGIETIEKSAQTDEV